MPLCNAQMRSLEEGAKKSASEVKTKIKDMESMQMFFQRLGEVRSMKGEAYWKAGEC